MRTEAQPLAWTALGAGGIVVRDRIQRGPLAGGSRLIALNLDAGDIVCRVGLGLSAAVIVGRRRIGVDVDPESLRVRLMVPVQGQSLA
jgi:hypothetical protein